jgi:YhcH/YjgK/YiaL family protein
MKISNIVKTAGVLVAFAVIGNNASAQAVSSKKAEDWVKSRAWANGLTINVYPDINAKEFYQQYHKNKEVWEKAFAFLADSKKLDTLKPGMYPIDGKEVYASITEGAEKTEETAKWESHRKYIDLQYVIRGKEKIGVAPLATATVTKPYDEAKDGANYTAEGKYYIATPVEFYLFFPSDVHRPNIKVDGYDTVKKLVIKIKYTE